ncbi:MAG: ATP-binding cassette domain-containing protein [Spirochaetales bacterium]|nr:ATP-binding cassette domain-containing protein [Spirochaetales bacterium]
MISAIQFKDVTFQWKEEENLFTSLTLDLPRGITSFTGQNGSGKSTLMLLAGGRILPQAGEIFLNGKKTDEYYNEEERNLTASFVYQNMEFETEETGGALLEQIGERGNLGVDAPAILKELTDALDLKDLLGRPLQNNSKGEMQRIISAFALLYGSPILFMDEPFFAMEQKQKEKALEYIQSYIHRREASLFISLHELELSTKYSDNTLLFYKDERMMLGETGEVLVKENIEEAYQLPMDLLHSKENLYREQLAKPASQLPEGLGQVKTID